MAETAFPRFPIMLVDDEEQALDSFEMVLRTARVNNFLRCPDSRDVMAQLSRQGIEAILLDLRMPHLSGEELLPMITSEYPQIPVIIVTGANDVETAVKCMRLGAFDYIVKPVEKSRLNACVRRAIDLRELQRENRSLREHVLSGKLENPGAFSKIITRSPKMRVIFQYIEAISTSPRPLIITGETGVGKELVAKSVHAHSGCEGEFIPVNVAGLDDNVFADTLFGHKKGAFTGADQVRSGLLEKAAGGILFLDEIGDLSPASQVKLLRLLQEGEFFPLGSDIAKRSDARIVVATNQELDTLRNSGSFRKDLYYRICHHHIDIPPLRDRKEDLPLLLHHFLTEASKAFEKKKPTPAPELNALLSSYHFPGNVREMESMVYDAVGSHRSGKLSLDVFKTHIFRHQKQGPEEWEKHFDMAESISVAFSERLPTLKQAEQILIEEAMRRAEDNQSVAAMSLGISRQALNKRLKKMNA